MKGDVRNLSIRQTGSLGKDGRQLVVQESVSSGHQEGIWVGR